MACTRARLGEHDLDRRLGFRWCQVFEWDDRQLELRLDGPHILQSLDEQALADDFVPAPRSVEDRIQDAAQRRIGEPAADHLQLQFTTADDVDIPFLLNCQNPLAERGVFPEDDRALAIELGLQVGSR